MSSIFAIGLFIFENFFEKPFYSWSYFWINGFRKAYAIVKIVTDLVKTAFLQLKVFLKSLRSNFLYLSPILELRPFIVSGKVVLAPYLSAGIDFFSFAPVTENAKSVCEIKYILCIVFLKKIVHFLKEEHSYLSHLI